MGGGKSKIAGKALVALPIKKILDELPSLQPRLENEAWLPVRGDEDH